MEGERRGGEKGRIVGEEGGIYEQNKGQFGWAVWSFHIPTFESRGTTGGGPLLKGNWGLHQHVGTHLKLSHEEIRQQGLSSTRVALTSSGKPV